MNYEKKYLKYKSKYIQLKKMIGGRSIEKEILDGKIFRHYSDLINDLIDHLNKKHSIKIDKKDLDEIVKDKTFNYDKIFNYYRNFIKKYPILKNKAKEFNEDGIRNIFEYYKDLIIQLSRENPNLDVIDDAIKLKHNDINENDIYSILKLSIENPNLNVINNMLKLKENRINSDYILEILKLSIENNLLELAVELTTRGFKDYDNIKRILELSIENRTVIDNAIKLKNAGIIKNIDDEYYNMKILELSIENPKKKIIDDAIKLIKADIDINDNMKILSLSIKKPKKKIIERAIDLRKGGMDSYDVAYKLVNKK